MGWVKTGLSQKCVFPYPLALALFAPVILLALAATACGSTPSAPDLPEIDLPPISRTVSTNIEPSTATPEPASTLAPTVTSVATAATDSEDVLPVPLLEIAEIPSNLPEYSRSDWRHWNDTDKDCQDTRAEVLIEESVVPPTFKNEDRCRVVSGLWEGPYTGQSFTEASDVDIDHLVPLKNAHLSGGWQWDDDRREDYANSMAADYHLVAVEKYANRAKGARGPEDWQPPDQSYHCQYARDWIAVKAAWGLTATAAEWEALEAMLATCPHAVVLGDDGGSIPPALSTSAPSPAPTPAVEAFSGSLVITEIMPDPSAVRDAAGEWFEVYNPDGEQPVDLDGWTVRKDEDNGHRISGELLVPPGGYIVMARNRDEAANGGVSVDYEYQGFNLTNDGDVIELVEPAGRVVDRVEYGEDLVFPGASASLDPGALDAAANDAEVNWCQATTAMPNGDFGTPGEENDAC